MSKKVNDITPNSMAAHVFSGTIFTFEEVLKIHFNYQKVPNGFIATHAKTGRRFKVTVEELDEV